MYLLSPVPHLLHNSWILPPVNTNPVNSSGCSYLSKIQITQTAIFSGTWQADTRFYDPQDASPISGAGFAEGVHTNGASPFVLESNCRPRLSFTRLANLFSSSTVTHKQQLGWAAIRGKAGCFAAARRTKSFSLFPSFWVFLTQKKLQSFAANQTQHTLSSARSWGQARTLWHSFTKS